MLFIVFYIKQFSELKKKGGKEGRKKRKERESERKETGKEEDKPGFISLFTRSCGQLYEISQFCLRN